MALKTRKLEMPQAKYSIKCPNPMVPEYIVIHNTANDASAENEIRYMQSNDAYTSFHYAVDDKEAVQGVDLWRNAWHAGDGSNGPGNRKGIAIEICYSKSGGSRFTKAEQNAAELAAMLLNDFGWDISHVKKHQDFSPWKYCPARTMDLGWDRFLKMVEAKRKELLGIKENEKTGQITLNGYTIERANDFSIKYWDKSKKKGTAESYINGGFFANYKENNVAFTLPVGNLVCDIEILNIPAEARKYVKSCVVGTKLRYAIANNAASDFKGRAVTTFVLPQNGTPYVKELVAPPNDCRYAISGIPVIRDGVDVSYNSFVKPQGWDASPFYATTRNFIGLKGSGIYIVSGTSKTSNFVATSEVYDALKAFGFDQAVALDGGGSAYHKYKGKADFVWSDRQVNNLILY